MYDNKGEPARPSRSIPPGTEFEASAVVELAQGQVHFRLADFSGWVYKYAEVEAADDAVDAGARDGDGAGDEGGSNDGDGTGAEARSSAGAKAVSTPMAKSAGKPAATPAMTPRRQRAAPSIVAIPNAPLICRIRNRHVNVRVTADLRSALVEPLRTLSPGEQFRCSRRVVVPKGGGQRFYKLCLGPGVEGWLFRKLEDGTEVVQEVSKPPLADECVIM